MKMKCLLPRFVVPLAGCHSTTLDASSSGWRSSGLRWSLYVSNKACNVACGAELGRFPLIYLLSQDDDSVVKQIFLMSLDLYSSGKSSFYYNLLAIFLDPLLVTEAKINLTTES